MRSSDLELWRVVSDGLPPTPVAPGVVSRFVGAVVAVRGARPWDRLGAPVGVAARVAVVLRGADWALEHATWPPPPVASPLPSVLCRTAERLTAASGGVRRVAGPPVLSQPDVAAMIRFIVGISAEVPAGVADVLEDHRAQVAAADQRCRGWLASGDLAEPDERFWDALGAAPSGDPLDGFDLTDAHLAGGLRSAVTEILAAVDGDTGLGVLDVPLACWWVAGGPFRYSQILADPASVRLDLAARLRSAMAFGAVQDVTLGSRDGHG